MYRNQRRFSFKNTVKTGIFCRWLQNPVGKKGLNPSGLASCVSHGGYSVPLHPNHYWYATPKTTKTQKNNSSFSCKCHIGGVIYRPLEATLQFNWLVFQGARAITGFTEELLSGLAVEGCSPLSSPHLISSGSANAPGFKGVEVTHMHVYSTHTAQSISPGPTLQLRDKWCGVSAGFCAKLGSLSAVCRTRLWRNTCTSTKKRCGKHEAARCWEFWSSY